MKKLLLILMVMASVNVMAQKFALIDMEYILKNVPAYERANEQLNQVSKKWQAEVDALTQEAQTLYKNYQSEAVFLSNEQKTQREEAIVAKEKEAAEYTRRDLQCCERHLGLERLQPDIGPCQRCWYHLC